MIRSTHISQRRHCNSDNGKIKDAVQDRVHLLHDPDKQAIPSQCLAAGNEILTWHENRDYSRMGDEPKADEEAFVENRQ